MYLILGYGKTGKAAHQYLIKNNKQCIVYDDAAINDFNIDWCNIECIIQSPGINLQHKIVQKAKDLNINIISDIELFQQNYPNIKYLGVTGTNGKSTTTDLINYVLTQNQLNSFEAGNIGVPILSIDKVSKDSIFVLELSSYQLEISKKITLDAAILTNISVDHLERHLTLENYYREKSKIFNYAKNKIIFENTLNAFDFKAFKKEDLTIIKEDDAIFTIVQNNQIIEIIEKIKFNNPFLKGRHNLLNMIAAYSICTLFIKNKQNIINVINNYKGLKHRQQFVRQLDNILFVNDSKATNADSTIQAVLAYKEHDILLILGGKAKSDGIKGLEPYFADIKQFFLIGESVQEFEKNLKGFNYLICNTLDTAVKKAFESAKNFKKPVILFSPACASFDQFDNFEHRGDVFIKLVTSIE